jgi:hypothetical protein
MPNKSPSITILEQDRSTYVTTTGVTLPAVVGYATFGPWSATGTPTLVTSKQEFIKLFGPPPTTAPWSSLAVYRAFNQTNQVLFTRVGASTGDSGIRLTYAERVLKGGTKVGDSTGDSNRILIQAKQYGSAMNGSYITISYRSNPANPADSLMDWRFYYKGDLTETFTGLKWWSGDSLGRFYGTKLGPTITSDNGGSAYFSVRTKRYGDSLKFKIPSGTYYIGVTDGADTRPAHVFAGDSWSIVWTHPTLAYDYRTGKDGVTTGGSYGLASGDTLFTNVLSTSAALANQELYDYHVLSTPDNNSEAVANAAITLAEYRKDFMYVVDPPYGYAYTDVANWHNGTGSKGRTTAMNSSYAATYWPWLKDYNSTTGQYVWCPPSVFIMEKYCEVDARFGGPWMACAGDVRGKIAASDYERTPSLSEREVLYGDLNAINPIVRFISKGLEIYGQKTLLRATTALSRINVRRMVIYAKKLIKKAMDSIVFEPHNSDSWTRARNYITSILEPIRQAQGLSDYRVVIDDTTNTPDLIAQGIMKGVIKLVPMGTIEIIELTIQIQASGSTIV